MVMFPAKPEIELSVALLSARSTPLIVTALVDVADTASQNTVPSLSNVAVMAIEVFCNWSPTGETMVTLGAGAKARYCTCTTLMWSAGAHTLASTQGINEYCPSHWRVHANSELLQSAHKPAKLLAQVALGAIVVQL